MPTPNIYEQGVIAVDSYNDPDDRGQDTEGWSIRGFDDGDKRSSGLKIQAYQKGNNIHIGVGGTDTNQAEFRADALTDFAFISGDLDPQFHQALEYAAKTIDDAYKEADRLRISRPDFSVSGHSLGGGMAQMISYVFGIPGISLDSPGVSNVINNSEFKQFVDGLREKYGSDVIPDASEINPEFINYIEKGSEVSGSSLTGDHLGKNNIVEFNNVSDLDTIVGKILINIDGPSRVFGLAMIVDGYLENHSNDVMLEKLQQLYGRSAQESVLADGSRVVEYYYGGEVSLRTETAADGQTLERIWAKKDDGSIWINQKNSDGVWQQRDYTAEQVQNEDINDPLDPQNDGVGPFNGENLNSSDFDSAGDSNDIEGLAWENIQILENGATLTTRGENFRSVISADGKQAYFEIDGVTTYKTPDRVWVKNVDGSVVINQKNTLGEWELRNYTADQVKNEDINNPFDPQYDGIGLFNGGNFDDADFDSIVNGDDISGLQWGSDTTNTTTVTDSTVDPTTGIPKYLDPASSNQNINERDWSNLSDRELNILADAGVRAGRQGLALINAIQNGEEFTAVDAGINLALELDRALDVGGDGFISNSGSNALGTASSAIRLASAIDNENWGSAVVSGYQLGDQLDIFEGSTSAARGVSSVASAYGLYTSIQNGNEFGAVTNAATLYNSLSATPLPGTAYLGYVNAGLQLLDGDIEGAAMSAATSYLSTVAVGVAAEVGGGASLLQAATTTANPYIIAAAAVVVAVLAIVGSADEPDPEASLSFAEDADGNVIFNTDSNKTGGGLEQQLTGLGGVLAQTVQAFENNLPAGVLPGDQVDVSTLPNVISIQNPKTGETQLRLEGGGGMGSSVLIVVGGASELIEIMPHIILYSDFQDAWITDVQTIVSENGQVFIDTYADPYASPPSDVVAKGAGIFVGGGNVGGNKELVVAKDDQIRNLAALPLKPVAKELAEVSRTWRIDKNIFEGNSGQLLAAGVATGLLSINDVYAAAGSETPTEQPPQSILDNEAYRTLVNEADSNLIVAGYGQLTNTPSQTGTPLNPIGPSEDYQSAFLAGYDGRYVDLNDSPANRSNGNAAFDNVPSAGSFIASDDEQTEANEANAQADLIRGLSRPASLNESPVLAEVTNTITINEGRAEASDASIVPLTGGQSDQLLVFEDRDVFTSIDQLLANDVAGVQFMGLSRVMNGSININAAGDIQFIPDSDFAGQAGFSYLIEDDRGEQQTVNVVVNVTNTNDAPDANDDVITFASNSALDLQLLLANDTDADNDALRLIAISQVNNGQIILNADGSYQFSPDAGFVGETQLTYVVEDANGVRSIAAAQLIVSNSVGQPVVIGDVTLPDSDNSAANDTGNRISHQEFNQPDFNLIEDENRLFSVEVLLGIQNKASTDTLQILNPRMLDSAQGTVTLTPDGEISFTPTENLTGEVTFEYEISNGVTSVPSQTFVKIWPENDAPATQDDQFSGLEDSNLILAGTELLANDSDVEGDSLSIVGIWGTSAGAQANYDANADQLTFTPPSNFFGDAWVDFLVEDAHGAWAVERSDIAIANVDDPAVAIDDNISLLEDQTRLILAEELTANDINLDREVLRINSIDTSLLTHGTAELLATGDVRFTPNADYAGTQTLRYELIDENGNLSSAQAILTVQQVNDAPRVQVSTGQAREDELVSFSFANLLTNATDIEGDAMQVVGVRSQFGSVGIDGVNGNITFQANTNFNSVLYGGPAVVEYLVADVLGAQSWGTLNVDVAPVNDAPSAGNDTVFTWASGPGTYTNTFNASDLLANDNDVDGETIFVDQFGQGANGVVSFDQASCIVSYLANTGFVGTDTFTYRVSDGVANSFGTGSVRVEVLQNTAPVASDFATIAPEDTVLRFDWADFMPYVSDQDLLQLELPEQLQVVSVSNAVNGAVSLNADGSVSFNPQDNFNSAQNQAVASFDYVVSDIVGNTSTATVSIDLTPVNDAPVANPESLPAIDEDSRGLIFTAAQLLLNDTDVDVDTAGIRDMDNLSLTIGNARHGRVTDLGNGQYRYTPDANYNGTDSIAYTISDPQGASDSSFAAITVRSINDNPVAEIVFGSGNDRDTNRLRNVLSHASDVDGDSLSLNVTGYSGGINSASASGGDLVWRANSAGSGRIYYDVLDGRGGVASSYADVRIAHANRPPTVVELTRTNLERADVQTKYNNGVAESRFHVEVHGYMRAIDSDGYIATYERAASPPGFRMRSDGSWSIELGWSNWFQGSYDQTFNYAIRAIDNESASVTRAFTVRVFLNAGDAYAGVVGPPLLFDLNNNGFELLSYVEGSEARFDLDGDGKRELTSWMAGGDGLLAVDINSDGIIDQSNEISFVDYVEGAKTDLEGLRYFDTDKNDELSANDSQWDQFGIWIDGNSDGNHDEGEWQKLDDIGIASIQLTSDGIAQDLGDGNELYGTGQFTWADGTTGEFADLGLSYQDEPELEITVDEILLEEGLGAEEGVLDGEDPLAIQEGLSDNTDAAGTDTDELAPDQMEDIALAEEEINTDIDSGTSFLPSDAELDRMAHNDVEAIVALAPKETVTPAPENIDILTESLVNTEDNNEEQQLVA
ncbi:MAG: tandem-95 repeat protein [Arenicellales bacterium]